VTNIHLHEQTIDDEEPPTAGSCHRFLPGPPDDGHERGEEGDERQQAEPERYLAAQEGAAVGDVVCGDLRRG
jgi:hypothetical protein